MEKWQERVIEEHAKLCERVIKLSDFMRGPESHKLTNEYRCVLHQQLTAMTLYIDALDTRIKCFQKDTPE